MGSHLPNGMVVTKREPMAKSDISILDAAVAEYFTSPHFPSIDMSEGYGRRCAIRGLMVRLNLYEQFTARVEAHPSNKAIPNIIAK